MIVAFCMLLATALAAGGAAHEIQVRREDARPVLLRSLWTGSAGTSTWELIEIRSPAAAELVGFVYDLCLEPLIVRCTTGPRSGPLYRLLVLADHGGLESDHVVALIRWSPEGWVVDMAFGPKNNRASAAGLERLESLVASLGAETTPGVMGILSEADAVSLGAEVARGGTALSLPGGVSVPAGGGPVGSPRALSGPVSVREAVPVGG